MKTQSMPSQPKGFALVVTLSLMILLTIIAVGLLTLSSVTLRSSALGSAQSMANSNARLALMLAIGELQKSLGPDQRISANASSFGAGVAQPNVVGAWESLGWQPPAGTPPSPSDKASKFRRWLISTLNPTDATDFTFPTRAEPADSIWLSNPATTGTIAPNNTRMRAQRVPLRVDTDRGGFAWMVSDESMKAPLNIPSAATQQIAMNIANRTAASSPQPGVLDSSIENIVATDPTRMISLPTAVLAVGAANKLQITARSQSLTSSSIGLLTNPVTGGLKTDLTPLLENKDSTDPVQAFGGLSPYFTTTDGAPSWEYLRSHYQLYKRIIGQNTALPKFVNRLNPDLAPGTVTSSNPYPGIVSVPSKEKLLPVIAKLQIMFSLVSHHSHISDRITAYNTRATPRGNDFHAVPHLVYDPVVTLYNPYDVELEIPHLRIRISDPPVGFQFRKHDITAGTAPWYRSEFANGEYHGLARFQIDNEKNEDARKVFTLFLRDERRTDQPGAVVKLLPGEVKVFSPWVNKRTPRAWTWGLETSGGYTPFAFFDWKTGNDLGNRDYRTSNAMGVETIPGTDFRAGFQTDHMSYGNGRPSDSKYTWETGGPWGAGWVSLKLNDPVTGESDQVTVNARPQRVVKSSSLPDFRVDILAGRNSTADSDIMRTYEFKLENVPVEMSPGSDPSKIITRTFKALDILQKPNEASTGGKSPFAIFTMTAKTTVDPNDDSKSWLFNNMVTEGASHDSSKIGNAAQSYDLRLQEVQDFTTFPGIEYDDANKRGYFGAIADSSSGVSIVPKYRVPVIPAASLGDWIASNLVASSQFPRVSYPLGNSFAHPLIPSDAISTNSPMPQGGSMLDHTYLMNAALWDHYFFSTATDYTSAAFSPTRGRSEVLDDFFTGKEPMLNSRLIPYISGSGSAQDLANDYTGLGDLEFANKFASNAVIQGAFNINSDSVDAWRSILSSLRDVSVQGYANQTYEIPDKTAFVRNGLPVAGSSDDANPANSVNALGQIRWAGFRTLTDTQIQNLATLIVEEIRARATEDSAPSLSLADFINRRIGSSTSIHALKGILQTAIDRSGVNDDFHQTDSNDINESSLADNRTRGLANPEALNGKTADGAAPFLTQGDLLTGLAPVITARGDTFTIRAYGEARTPDGNTVLARSWCEATVQRTLDFVDGTDLPEADPAALTIQNKNFGRRFVITSFRWLNANEV